MARDLEQTLRAEAEHPVWRSHVAKYRSLMPSLALIGHLIDGVDGGPTGPGASRGHLKRCAPIHPAIQQRFLGV